MAASPLLDGSRLRAWARRAAGELEQRRVEINQLNVFPVPDADTGSNMAHTMAAAVEEAEGLPEDASFNDVAGALAMGAVRGARGNSGVVLSQVMRGIAQSVQEENTDAAVIADALGSAVKFVNRAIAQPVEGTVITVLRAAAVAAQQELEGATKASGERGAVTALDVARAATDAASVALSHTPSQLAALREAGVVDAGGTGLVILLEALVQELSGVAGVHEAELHPVHESPAQPVELEVLFFFDGDVAALEEAISPLGRSLVVARVSETQAKVHIHSRQAGTVVETAFAQGRVRDLTLEALPPVPETENPHRLIVAVTPPGSLTQLYREAGAETVAPGADVVSDVLAAIKRSASSEVIVLPNGLLSSANLAAAEKAARALEQTITMLPTVRLVSGIAALAVHDPQQPLATAAFTMSEAAGEMRTAVAHRAQRGALTQSGAVARGDVVVSARGETVLIAEDPQDAVKAACTRLLEHGGEQVTILFDPTELSGTDLEPLAAELGVDVMVYPADALGALAEIGVE